MMVLRVGVTFALVVGLFSLGMIKVASDVVSGPAVAVSAPRL